MAIVLVALVALPILLSVVYRAEFIRPVSTLMLADIVALEAPRRDWVEIDDVAPVMLQSVVMSEDGQFCSHRGVDWGAMREVVDDLLDGERARGASTVTMQTAKNLFLWNSRSFIRKGLELPIAIWLDLVLPKKRIMEIYLNIAEWGPSMYGVEAASQTYFGVPASKLTTQQATLLTVALPNPHARNPSKPGNGMRRLAGRIADRVAKFGDRAGCLY